ncbi:MAG: hypothetical protein J6U53_00835 [Tidjanibacter sp.]|nr:hypothetical protein [Tidjanibacter sp.]
MKRLLLILAVLLGGVATLSAQRPAHGQLLEDVIYLKSGSVLRGVIVEQMPMVNYVIATIDGSTLTVDARSVEKITVEPVVVREETTDVHLCYSNPFMPHKHDADGNIIYPLSPAGAFMRSLIIPGMGQMVNGEELKGTLLLTGTIMGIVGFTFGANAVPARYSDLVGYSGVALAAGCYLYSLIDAPIFAHRWNKKYGFKSSDYNYMTLAPAIGISGRHRAMGVNVAIGF